MNVRLSFLHATIKRGFDLVYRCLARGGPRNSLYKTLGERKKVETKGAMVQT